MKKMLSIPLEDEEIIELCRILIDKDAADALEFLQTHVKGKAQVMGNMGSVLEGQERFEEAVDAYKQSATMFEQIGDGDSAMYTWQALSRLRMNQGQWLSAIAAYEEGIENMPDRSLKKSLLKRILSLPGGLMRGQ